MSKIIEIKIGYPTECPHRRTVSIPNTDGYFKYVCNENCEINCMLELRKMYKEKNRFYQKLEAQNQEV